MALARLTGFDHHPGLILQSRVCELTQDLKQHPLGMGAIRLGGVELGTAPFVWWEVLGPLGPGGECFLMGRLGHGTFAIKSVLGRRVRSLPGLRCVGLCWTVVAVERS